MRDSRTLEGEIPDLLSELPIFIEVRKRYVLIWADRKGKTNRTEHTNVNVNVNVNARRNFYDFKGSYYNNL
jgi:hypothetical protein